MGHLSNNNNKNNNNNNKKKKKKKKNNDIENYNNDNSFRIRIDIANQDAPMGCGADD